MWSTPSAIFFYWPVCRDALCLAGGERCKQWNSGTAPPPVISVNYSLRRPTLGSLRFEISRLLKFLQNWCTWCQDAATKEWNTCLVSDACHNMPFFAYSLHLLSCDCSPAVVTHDFLFCRHDHSWLWLPLFSATIAFSLLHFNSLLLPLQLHFLVKLPDSDLLSTRWDCKYQQSSSLSS